MSIKFNIEDHIAFVVLDRPEAMNAIDYPTRRALQDIWRCISTNDQVQAVVVTGAGEKAFCTGSDLRNTPPPATSFAEETFGAGINDSLMDGLDTDKPLICAFNGAAFGGGLEIGLACDIRIASVNARFALSEVKMGTIPGSGGTQRLPRLIGQSNAMLMLLTGDPIDADEALRIGLVSKVVASSELRATATAIARRIIENAPLPVRAVKRLVREGLEMPLDLALVHERHVWGLLRDTQDRKEGRAAFAEKRKPNYQGR